MEYQKMLDLKKIEEVFHDVSIKTKHKNKIVNFKLFYVTNIMQIYKVLEQKKYSHGPYNIFLVKEHKYRLIMSENISDKIINHLLSKEILLPAIEPRLIDMNIEPFLLSSAIVGIIAQRLVKRLCPKCKFEYTSTKEEMEYLGINEPIKLYKATGCKECDQTGYKGRLAIHEVLPVTTDIKRLIGRNANEYEIEETAVKQGMTTLKQDGTEYVIKGIISIEELMKATYSI